MKIATEKANEECKFKNFSKRRSKKYYSPFGSCSGGGQKSESTVLSDF